MLTIFLVFYLISCIHVLSMALAAKLLNISIKQISFGFGKTLLSYKIFTLSVLPLGGYVKLFDSRNEELSPYQSAFNEQQLWKQLLVPLCGPFVTLLIAFLCIGSQAFDSFINAFIEVFYGAISPTEKAQEYLSNADLFVSQSSIVVTIGVITSKITALNLLPLTGTTGGQTIFTLINRGQEQTSGQETFLQLFFWPFVLLFLSWFTAILYWFW